MDTLKAYTKAVQKAIAADPECNAQDYAWCCQRVKGALAAAHVSVSTALRGDAHKNAVARALFVAIKPYATRK